PGWLKSVKSVTNTNTRTSCSSWKQHCLFATSLREARVLRPCSEWFRRFEEDQAVPAKKRSPILKADINVRILHLVIYSLMKLTQIYSDKRCVQFLSLKGKVECEKIVIRKVSTMDEQAWRKYMITQLKQLSTHKKVIYEQAIQQRTLNSILWDTASVVGITYAQIFEWNTIPLVHNALENGKIITFPKANPKTREMDFFSIN